MRAYIAAVGLVLLSLPLLLFAQEETPVLPTPPIYSDSVYINEFLPNPAGDDNTLEFIELYNDSDAAVSMSEWAFMNGSGQTFAISADISILAKGYLVFYSAETGSLLANSGDRRIQLIDPDDIIHEDVPYSGSEEGQSYNRTEEGIYLKSPITTPGEANLFPTPTPSATPSPTPTITLAPSATPTVSPTPTPPPVSYSSSVHINEFLPNPKGDDTVLEFIELFNSSGDEVDISDWKIDTGGSASFIIPNNTILNSESYLALYRVTTKLSLNNTGNHRVRLLDPIGTIHEDAQYDGSREGHSYNWVGDGAYQQSSTPTPNGQNILSDIEDPTPTPSADDEEEQSKVAGIETASYDFSSKIIINEFLPNPAGLDTEQEFIEIKNTDTKAINLLGWKLDDGEKGSSPHVFTTDDTIAPGAIALFFRSLTKIALNNNADTVRLIDPSGKVVDAISYISPVPEGQSYARDAQGTFFWSQEVTPDEENTIDVQLREKKKETTAKPKQAKMASSRTGAVQSAISRSAAATIQPHLAWQDIDEGVVTRTVAGGARNEPREKQKLFIVFGSIAAVGQFLNGIFSKERIWHKP